MAIEDIVNVQITISDASPSVASFGRPLILALAPYVGGRQYNLSPSGLAAMITDGFTLNDRAYQLASTMAAQNPSTTDVIVYGRTDTGSIQLIEMIPVNVTEGYVYTFNVVLGTVVTPITYTVGAAATVAANVTAIQLLVNAVTGVTAADVTTHLTITGTTVGTVVQIDNLVSGATISDASAAGNVATDLAAAAADVELDWYSFVLDSYIAAEIAAASTFAEANQKIFAAASADSDIWVTGSSDILSTLQATAVHYTYLVPTRDMSGDAAAALLARQLSRDPGSSNWSYQTLAGPIADAWSGSELGFIHSKGGIAYVNTQGVSHSFGVNGVGKAVSGRSLSITRGADKLQADIEVNVLTTFLNSEKVPYTPTGIAQLESAVRSALSASATSGLILTDFTVTPPVFSTITAAQRATGVLQNLEFHANLQGEIGKVSPLNGTLSF